MRAAVEQGQLPFTLVENTFLWIITINHQYAISFHVMQDVGEQYRKGRFADSAFLVADGNKNRFLFHAYMISDKIMSFPAPIVLPSVPGTADTHMIPYIPDTPFMPERLLMPSIASMPPISYPV